MLHRTCLLFLVVAAAACAPHPMLVPEAGGDTAHASAAGLSLAAAADVWEAPPADLPDYLTPIAVSLHNATAAPVSVRYQDFGLRNDAGFRFAALPPMVAENQLIEIARAHGVYAYPGGGFWFGRPGWWGFGWGFSPGYYYQPDYRTFDQVVQMALQEGVLEPGGSADGFIYFPRALARTTHLALEWQTAQATLSARFAVVR
jgi:hypothetical protein